ncbi:aminoglycoside N(3)-acetyltransferase [Paenibacillus methanolicus]|uniref:Aminoglycoside N(3)-acetyltransferase n=1 Tax=Paenibacillus methanolicus TaxID=582686 RepID=A0A5S5BVV6_9BACL|nr:AAC(3) family N-acetyltransferase [Paenibacillus methanolicus]TYP69743.1 aminoglycoside 3-N-acetyltransferase [Paenibacillus methanolicus]
MKGTTGEQRMILTREDLVQGLRGCGLQAGSTVIAHSSMRKLGFIVGGAETLVRALLDVVGEEGTIVLPSQTWKNLDPETGVHGEEPEAWWPIIREHWPAYDKAVTPSIGMGAAAETLRAWPGAERSDHPARSFAAVGKHAAEVTRDHDLRNIFGDGSPLAKLYELDGDILLIGVGHDKNTSLHLAEYRANYPGKRLATENSAIMVDGKRSWVAYETLAVDDADFVRLGELYEREHGIVPQRIGGAEVRLLKQRPLIDWAVNWMNANRS